MDLEIAGPDPLARDEDGRPRCRIATLFPSTGTLVTVPGIHATQRLAYVGEMNRRRAAAGQEPLSAAEESQAWHEAVDLIIDAEAILIRPVPEKMDLAFRADEILQQLAPKHRIKFLCVCNEQVRQAVKRRGQCWRITPLARSVDEMSRLVERARVAIGGRPIYYYNAAEGIRLLTVEEFSRLGELDDASLRAHLLEIQEYSACRGRHGKELDFFKAEGRFAAEALAGLDFGAMDGEALRGVHARLKAQFAAAVAPAFQSDQPDDPEWRSQMYAALIGEPEEAVSEERLLRLGAEFYMQVQWLPGGRIEDGELVFDSILEQRPDPADPELACLWDEKCREIIWNYIREYSDVEYINVGRVIGSLSRRPSFYGRRDVYVAVLKQRNQRREIVQVVRVQKWGVREHLDEGRDLLEAMIRSEAYTDYILDRRLACRQFCMNLAPRLTAKKLQEEYRGHQQRYHGTFIWSPYFQRDYIAGVATDKIPLYRFEDPAYALAFARLLGRAAAPNLLVGRSDLGGNVLFDDGDEVVLEDAAGIPGEIVVADLTGTFADYLSDLRDLAGFYAEPLRKRLEAVTEPEDFVAAYLDAFEAQLLSIRREYERHKRAFDSLFKHLDHGSPGSLPDRWRHVLGRLCQSDPRCLREIIAGQVYGNQPVI